MTEKILWSGEIEEGDSIKSAPDHSEHEHYEFTGWSADGFYVEFPYTPESDIRFISEYDINVYSYSFSDGVSALPVIGAENALTEITAPEPSLKDHYEFIGWYDGESIAEFPYTLIKDVEFTAIYEKMTYTYSFVSDGVTISSGSAEALSEVNAPEVGRKHYVFTGWSVDGAAVTMPYTLYGDTVFVATYMAVNYTITYHLDGGLNSSYNPEVFNADMSQIILSDPHRDCYTFEGWYTDPGYSERVISLSPDNGNTDLYAKWSDPSHQYGEDHLCRICGAHSPIKGHTYSGSHICTVCGHEETEHDFVDGECIMCGQICAHEYDESHICMICGNSASSAEHVFDETHTCIICGYEYGSKEHIYGSEHVCDICDYEHTGHTYGYDHICTVCGMPYKTTEHEFIDGSCIVCGKTLTNAWDGSVSDGFSAGTGTAEDPYVITDASELAYLSASVNSGERYAGRYFILAEDIDLNGIPWTPIGTGHYSSDGTDDKYAFAGNFDGNGHKITGLYIDSAEKEFDSVTRKNHVSAGLFGAIAGTGGGDLVAAVKNLYIRDCRITISLTDDTSALSAGILAGTVKKTAISGCMVTGTVTIRSAGEVNAGGVAGTIGDSNLYGSMVNCVSDVQITVTAASVLNAGGFAGGCYYGNINKCCSYSDISVSGEAVKVAGFAVDLHSSYISNCYSETGIVITEETDPDTVQKDVFALVSGTVTENSYGENSVINGMPGSSDANATAVSGADKFVYGLDDKELIICNGIAIPAALEKTFLS